MIYTSYFADIENKKYREPSFQNHNKKFEKCLIRWLIFRKDFSVLIN